MAGSGAAWRTAARATAAAPASARRFSAAAGGGGGGGAGGRPPSAAAAPPGFYIPPGPGVGPRGGDVPPGVLRSTAWFGKLDKDGFIHRSWMRNQGLPPNAFDGRPVIGIANTFSELT
jgi:hypothetical protein